MKDSAIQINFSSSSSFTPWSSFSSIDFVSPLHSIRVMARRKAGKKEKDSFYFSIFLSQRDVHSTGILRPLYIDWFSLRSYSPSLFSFSSSFLIVPLFARFPFNGAQVAEKLRPTRVSGNSSSRECR